MALSEPRKLELTERFLNGVSGASNHWVEGADAEASMHGKPDELSGEELKFMEQLASGLNRRGDDFYQKPSEGVVRFGPEDPAELRGCKYSKTAPFYRVNDTDDAPDADPTGSMA